MGFIRVGFFGWFFYCHPCLDGLAAGDGQEDEDPVAVASLGDEAALCGGLEAPDPGGTVVGQGRLQGAQAPVARSYCGQRSGTVYKQSNKPFKGKASVLRHIHRLSKQCAYTFKKTWA